MGCFPASVLLIRDGCVDSLALNSGDEKLEKAIGVNFYADFCVGADFVEALDNVVIAVEDIALYRAVTVGDGFAASEFASGFDVNVHLGSLDQHGIYGDTYG